MWLQSCRIGNSRTILSLYDVLLLMSAYVIDCSGDFWLGHAPLLDQLTRFTTLPVKKNERNNKWYGYTMNGLTGRGSICLGCAIFSGILTNAEKQCPLSLCRSRQCISQSHPCFQDIICHLRHHHTHETVTASAFLEIRRGEVDDIIDEYEKEGNELIYSNLEHLNGKMTVKCLYVSCTSQSTICMCLQPLYDCYVFINYVYILERNTVKKRE
jgi:hypothetical protein